MSDSSVNTPVHLWIFGILAVLWNAMGATDYYMTRTKNEAWMESFTPEQLDFFYGLPDWGVVCWAVAVWCGLFGSLLLLMRKTIAAPLLLASFLAMVVTTVHNYGMSNGYEVMGQAGAIFAGVIFVISLALVFYSRAMKARGVLR